MQVQRCGRGFLPIISLCRLQTRLYSLQRNVPKIATINNHHRYRYKSSKTSTPSEDIDLDEPIKFSTSRAAKWKAEQSYGATDIDDRPWYQPYTVIISLATFLIYFCVLREENATDVELRKTLYDHIEGLEERQLEMSLEYSRDAGKDTTAIVKRLEELKEMKPKE